MSLLIYIRWKYLPFRPYCLPESIEAVAQEKRRLQNVCSSLFERKPEDLTTAHAILDLSTSHLNLPPPPPLISAPAAPCHPSHQAQPPPLIHSTSPPTTTTIITTPTATNHGAGNNSNNNNSSSEQNLNFPLATVDTNKQGKGTKNSKSDKKKAANKKESKSAAGSATTITTASSSTNTPTPTATKTIAYTYEAFFISDGRSKKKQQQQQQLNNANPPGSSSASATSSSSSPKENASLSPATPVKLNGSRTNSANNNNNADLCSDSEGDTLSLSSGVSGGVHSSSPGDEIGLLGPKEKSRYTCSDCGKNYATSSNLSRHKQTHRSLDSQAAKRYQVLF